MNINLTISVDHPEELPRVLQHLAASFAGAVPASVERPVVREADDTPKPRGRPRKNADATGSAEPSEVAPTQPETQAAESDAAPEAPVATLERKDVQKLLVAVVQKHGVAACSAICHAHGGPNLSALDPSTYPSVVAACHKALQSDPAA